MACLLFCTVLYKYTLRAWFQADDFAWLGLRLQVHNWPDFWHAMFSPMAQGSLGPSSERAFFMGFYSPFGIHALPYRLAVYVTQLGVIAIVSSLFRTAPGKKEIEVVIHVDRTMRVGFDQRDLGLAVRTIEVVDATGR